MPKPEVVPERLLDEAGAPGAGGAAAEWGHDQLDLRSD